MTLINIRFGDLKPEKQVELSMQFPYTVLGPETSLVYIHTYEGKDLDVDIEEARIEREFLKDKDIH